MLVMTVFEAIEMTLTSNSLYLTKGGQAILIPYRPQATTNT